MKGRTVRTWADVSPRERRRFIRDMADEMVSWIMVADVSQRRTYRLALAHLRTLAARKPDGTKTKRATTKGRAR